MDPAQKLYRKYAEAIHFKEITQRLFVFFFFLPMLLSAGNPDEIQLKWSIVPDNNFTIQNILSDQIAWSSNDTIIPGRHKVYWFKIEVNVPSRGLYFISINPGIDLTSYIIDNTGGIKEYRAGVRHNSPRSRHQKILCELEKDIYNRMFVRVDASAISEGRYFFPKVRIESFELIEKREKIIQLLALISCIIIILYMLNIAIDYWILREPTHKYYLVSLLGALLYVLTYHNILNLITDLRLVRIFGNTESMIFFGDLNYLLNRISIITLVFGIFQLSRNFLNTRNLSPGWDTRLKYFMIFFIGTNLTSLLMSYFTPFPVDIHFIFFSNMMIILGSVLVITVSTIIYRYDKKNVKLFWMANLIPIFLIIISTLLLETTNDQTLASLFIPYISILSFPVTYSTALAIRVRNVRKELNDKMNLSKQLAFENEKMQLEKDLHMLKAKDIENQLELEKMNTENMKLNLDLQNREMLISALKLQQKEEILKKIESETQKLKTDAGSPASSALTAIRQLILNHDANESTWESFRVYFEKIHPDFFTHLKKNHPNLTQNEIRLSAYMALNLSNKEIALLQNIDPASVKRAKIRLKHKMNGNAE
jgi:hypothetical protein